MRYISLCDKIWIFFQSVFTSILHTLVNDMASHPKHFGYFCHRVLVPVAMYIHNIIIENYFHSNNTLVENFPAISLHSIFSLCMLHNTYPTELDQLRINPELLPNLEKPDLAWFTTIQKIFHRFEELEWVLQQVLVWVKQNKKNYAHLIYLNIYCPSSRPGLIPNLGKYWYIYISCPKSDFIPVPL